MAVGVKVGLMLAAFAGKAAGGIVGDRFGWLSTSVGALLLSLPLIAFLGHLPVALIAGFLLFQMTMPVTLTAVERLMPGRPGTAFGLACLALIAGSLLAFSELVQEWYSSGFFTALIAASALSLWVSLRLLKPSVPTAFSP